MIDDHDAALLPGQLRVVIEAAERDADVLTTRARVIDGQVPAILDSPGSLFRERMGDGVEVHRVDRLGPDRLIFRTFGDAAVPAVGDTFVVQWWWIPRTQEMLYGADWRRERITEHRYCPLTYESLDEGDVGYTDGHDHWISEAGWEAYVRDDRLRLMTS